MKELADLFHIAPSALRYWDAQGLIHFERSPDNRYRIPSFQTMLDICEVLLYRRLSIPVKDIRRIPAMNAEQLRDSFSGNEQKLEDALLSLRESLSMLQARKSMLDRLMELRRARPCATLIRLPEIQAFSFENAEMLRLYVREPYRSAVVWRPGEEAPRYGMITDLKGECLRGQDAEERLYLQGVFQVSSNCDTLHNGAQLIGQAMKMGDSPKEIIGRYLISACEGETRYDFYEAWVQISRRADVQAGL